MSNQKRDYDSTVARIAGNVAGQVMVFGEGIDPDWTAKMAVAIARAIVEETKRTEPVKPHETIEFPDPNPFIINRA